MRFGFSHHCPSPMSGSRWGSDSRYGSGGYSSRYSRTRMFEQGDLRFVILKLLEEKPAHGYEIIKLVEGKFGGAYAPSPGIVYPTLTLLEEEGSIVVVETDGPRKLFGLTDKGRAEVTQSAPDIDRVFARMDELRQKYGGSIAPEILRAVENLKSAVKLRIDRGDAVDSRKLTAILDGAARSIEDL